MPKRKRAGEPKLQEKLDRSTDEVFRALKVAKGFERQRLSKRLHEQGLAQDKQARLEREVAALKSLDLRQTARAHLFSSLFKVKSIAASTDLPDEVRTGVPKPDLSAEEKAALHNVTSGLYSREPVKQAIDRAIAAVCHLLGVPTSRESRRRERRDQREGREGQPDDRIPPSASGPVSPTSPVSPTGAARVRQRGREKLKEKGEEEIDKRDEDETDFEGFQSDVDEPKPAVGESSAEDEAAELAALSKYDHLLGSSSDDSEDPDVGQDVLDRYRGVERVNLDDVSLSGSEPGSGSISDVESTSDLRPSSQTPARVPSPSPSPPPPKRSSKSTAADPGPSRASTFLPSLMGGYISGSESASDIDVAPPKKRRGQRQRQAIYEKKYGAKANHLKRDSKNRGRDAGWDARRGAVDGERQAGHRTPWKKGIANPLAKKNGGREQDQVRSEPRRAKDTDGPLHPSWEARRKAKDSQKTAAFAGQKITF